MGMIDHETLLSLLVYSKTTGEFRWLQDRKGGPRGVVRKGDVAGCLKRGKDGGYIVIRILGVLYRAHRLAWFYETGEWPENEIDHDNGVRHDNRWRNLKEATSAQNSQNMSKMRTNTTGYTGVTRVKSGRYMAQIYAGGKNHYAGTYDTPEEAHAAYLAKKKELHTYSPILRDNHGAGAAPSKEF